MLITIGFQLTAEASQGHSPGFAAPIAFASGTPYQCSSGALFFPYPSNAYIGWLYREPQNTDTRDNDGVTRMPHAGIDVYSADGQGAAVYAPVSGDVVIAGDASLDIRSQASGIEVYVGHMHSMTTKSPVTAGVDVIGYQGGDGFNDHVHVSVGAYPHHNDTHIEEDWNPSGFFGANLSWTGRNEQEHHDWSLDKWCTGSGSTLGGDLDHDGRISIFDYNILVANFGRTDCDDQADIDGDCRVSIFDYNILVGNFGKSATLTQAPSLPAKPTNLSATALSSSSIQVNWQDNANNETGVDVDRWNGSAWVKLVGLGANATTYSDTGLQPSTNYNYLICPWNVAGGNCSDTSTGATTQGSSTSRSEVIVDDQSSGFQKSGSFFAEATRGYANHTFWTYSNGSVTDSWANWWTSSLGTGNYEVFAYIPGDNATTTNAKYEIAFDNNGIATRSINQNAYFDNWESLGTYYFTPATYRVRLTDATGESPGATKVAMDAIKWVPR